MNKKAKTAVLWLAVCLSSLLVTVIAVPAVIVKKAPHAGQAVPQPSATGEGMERANELPPIVVPVYLTKQQKTMSLPLETYVQGVLAAEMPIDFSFEALKAQALASRTYVVRRMVEQDKGGMPVKDALVTDSATHQVFVTEDELKERWGAQYKANMEKLERVVNETRDLILTYQGQPINATFFSTSNGYTENAEDYWGQFIPYLRSVPSPWDEKLSPRFKETVSIPVKDVQRKLGINAVIPVSGNANSGMQVISRTQGHRIQKVVIGGKTFTGRDVREKLGLNSSQFQWSVKSGQLDITTFGYGHGVGMSQWGANGMALEGRSAEEIVKYYYTGIEISHASSFMQKPPL